MILKIYFKTKPFTKFIESIIHRWWGSGIGITVQRIIPMGDMQKNPGSKFKYLLLDRKWNDIKEFCKMELVQYTYLISNKLIIS